MAEQNEATGEFKIKSPNLQWSEEIGRGQYANTINVMATHYEVVLDFSFRGGKPTGTSDPITDGHNIHMARVILSFKAAEELRDLLNRNLPQRDAQ